MSYIPICLFSRILTTFSLVYSDFIYDKAQFENTLPSNNIASILSISTLDYPSTHIPTPSPTSSVLRSLKHYKICETFLYSTDLLFALSDMCDYIDEATTTDGEAGSGLLIRAPNDSDTKLAIIVMAYRTCRFLGVSAGRD